MKYTAILNDRVASILTGKDGATIQSSDKGTEVVTNSAAVTNGEGNEASNQQAAAPGTSIFVMIFYFVIIFVVFYFVLIRPQRKREKKAKEMREGLRVGDPVVLSSGMYGKIVDVGDDVFVIELGMNRGIRVPVSKQDVIGVKEPVLTPKKHDDSKKIEDKKSDDKKEKHVDLKKDKNADNKEAKDMNDSKTE